MNSLKVGIITENERNEIRELYFRNVALHELILTLTKSTLVNKEDNELYQKIISDCAITTSKYDAWWREKEMKYQWKSENNCKYRVDFETCEVFFERMSD